MSDILHKTTVLVLNRHWQAIHAKTPADAFCMMASGAATGLDVQGEDAIIPVKWDEWLKLPVRRGPVGKHASRHRAGAHGRGRRELRKSSAASPAPGCPRDLGARWRRLPVHRPQACAARGEHRPHRSPLAWRRHHLGELRALAPGRQLPQGCSSAAGSRPAIGALAAAAQSHACDPVHPQRPRHP